MGAETLMVCLLLYCHTQHGAWHRMGPPKTLLNEVMKGLPWWLRFLAPKAEGTGLIPDWRTKILPASQPKKKKERDYGEMNWGAVGIYTLS